MSKVYFALLGAGLMAVTLLQFSPLQAQTKNVDGTVPDDRVVATVKGSKVLFRDVRLAYENLPQQYRGLPLTQLYQPLVQQLVERQATVLLRQVLVG